MFMQLVLMCTWLWLFLHRKETTFWEELIEREKFSVFLKWRNSSDPLGSEQCSQTDCKYKLSFYFSLFLTEFWGSKTTSKYHPSFFQQPWFPFKHLLLLDVEDIDTWIRYRPGQTKSIGEINTAFLLIKVPV